MDEACARVEQTFDVPPEKVALLREIVEVQRTLPEPGTGGGRPVCFHSLLPHALRLLLLPRRGRGQGQADPAVSGRASVGMLEEAERLFRQAKLGAAGGVRGRRNAHRAGRNRISPG